MSSQTIAKQEGARETMPANGAPERFLQPPVDIHETHEGYVLEADLPGVNRKGLEVLLEDNELTLIGRKQRRPSGGEAVLRESMPLNYRRTFVIDPSIDTSKITARLEHGVLRMELPKAEKVKPRKIAITD